ncbi:energy transducer TonB [Mucilaginibacter myungsuensis]|uniref:Energy transducer TonB n=1 Tax=Mucilaginibacter myungsuensis TaxID=649104 RepID=A0A929KV00_9SPHI|nr:energy transducer TonB [Mucilaginibacter myungsuensis]MBE9661247.1 energy transducer TonB [Mucilaginibacter myungsuensis]MDN3597390.1 energy transducer TonB [Mucilaginibacter myungsuensis]
MKKTSLALLFNLLTLTVSAQKLDTKLISQLMAIDQADQQFRSKEAQHGAQTKEQDADNMRKQSALDEANLTKIEAIIAKHGYPGKSLVGNEYQSVAFMVIQHADAPAREKYLPMIIKAAEQGELRASSVAIMVDRTLTDKGQPQLYGSQMHETSKGVKLYPIADEQHVDIRRKKVGLSPLEDYLKPWNISYKVPMANHQNPAEIYYVPEHNPAADAELIGTMRSLHQKLTYPAAAKEKNISGYVTVELTIDKNGEVQNPQVVKSLGYGCDEEALRVIKEAKFTNPARQDVEKRFRLPFPADIAK